MAAIDREKSLCGLLPDQLTGALAISPSFRGMQIFEWIHQKGAVDFESMSNLPLAMRAQLSESFGTPFSSRVSELREDDDGTVKITVELHDGGLIESVLLNDENDRRTACLSSQIGCALGCTFCKTGTMGLIRNLTAGEIVEQYLHLRNRYGEIQNIVFMGMGEPLMNLTEILKAIEVFHHPRGLNIGMRRITVSTSGIIEGIDRLADTGLQLRLAVSLITPDQNLRAQLMPIAKKVTLDQLQAALIRFQQTQQRRITLEYVVFRGRNTRKEDVEALVRFIRPLKALVNIIPWNPVEGLDFREPDEREVRQFQQKLEQRGITVSRRFRRGRGVNGACGQLAVQNPPLDASDQATQGRP